MKIVGCDLNTYTDKVMTLKLHPYDVRAETSKCHDTIEKDSASSNSQRGMYIKGKLRHKQGWRKR